MSTKLHDHVWVVYRPKHMVEGFVLDSVYRTRAQARMRVKNLKIIETHLKRKCKIQKYPR